MPGSSCPLGEGDLRCRDDPSCPFFQGLGPAPPGTLDPGAVSSTQGTNTVVTGGQARHGVAPGRHHRAQSVFSPLVLSSFFPYWSLLGRAWLGGHLNHCPRPLTPGPWPALRGWSPSAISVLDCGGVPVLAGQGQREPSKGCCGWRLARQGESPFPFPELPVPMWMQRVELGRREGSKAFPRLSLLLPAGSVEQHRPKP